MTHLSPSEAFHTRACVTGAQLCHAPTLTGIQHVCFSRVPGLKTLIMSVLQYSCVRPSKQMEFPNPNKLDETHMVTNCFVCGVGVGGGCKSNPACLGLERESCIVWAGRGRYGRSLYRGTGAAPVANGFPKALAHARGAEALFAVCAFLMRRGRPWGPSRGRQQQQQRQLSSLFRLF